MAKGGVNVKFSWKTAAAMVCSLFGILGWCYVGAYMILTKPVRGLFDAFFAGEFTVGTILLALIEMFLYLSLAGAVWCIGYMGSDYFKTWEKEKRSSE